MDELLRLARAIRCGTDDPGQTFSHRLRVGVAVAGLILVVSLLR